MNLTYTETLHGSVLVRPAPGPRHERICAKLHQSLQASVAALTSTRLLPPRAEVRMDSHSTFCPDLALVTAATQKLWLAAEIVSAEDHATDTVVKKQIYEELRLPRLWMLDPRYDNLEVYHGSPYGLVLKSILAGNQLLTEPLLPQFRIRVAELFQA